ncbi:hypothetical protein HMPREF9397_0682 [Streptococcus sanguinis SK1087]|uniref:Uncharacterized protein n=1 Tax=Streptococcus sanguinis SK1087 TaxID=888824 RepID=F3SHR0_STRSA|nr:hypothetical protein HMPREF9397_0682 [Streptococcus sanguinis SK1087]
MLALLSYLVPSFILVSNTSNVKLNIEEWLLFSRIYLFCQ